MEGAVGMAMPLPSPRWITGLMTGKTARLQNWRKWPAAGIQRQLGKRRRCRCRCSLAAHGVGGLTWRSLGGLLPVGVALLVSQQQGMALERPMVVAIARSCLQLTVLGFTLRLVFEGNQLVMSMVGLAFMVCVAGYTAGERAKKVPRSHAIACTSLAIGAGGSIGLMLLLGVVDWRPSHLIPAAGYVIGNSMSMVGGCLNRLYQNVAVQRGRVEASLALGATPEQAVRVERGRGTRQALAPLVDSLKTTGLVALPGSMAGMLMAGCAPLDAMALQMHVSYMLIGASALSCFIATFLAVRSLFTQAYQLDLQSD